MNEYVNIDMMETEKLAVYEPIDLRPIVKGSLRGTIYNGDEEIQFRVSDAGVIFVSGLIGNFNNITGVIKIAYNEKPHEENYLCVSYEHGEEDPPQKLNWLQEGF